MLKKIKNVCVIIKKKSLCMLGLKPIQPVDGDEEEDESALPGSTVVVGGLETLDANPTQSALSLPTHSHNTTYPGPSY